MAELRTSREALVAELLGDLDGLMARVERLPKAVEQSEERMEKTISALDEAGDRYRLAITTFTEQSRAEVTRFLERKAAEVAAKATEEQRTLLQGHAASLSAQLKSAASEINSRGTPNWLQLGVTSLLTSILTTGLMLLTGR